MWRLALVVSALVTIGAAVVLTGPEPDGSDWPRHSNCPGTLLTSTVADIYDEAYRRGVPASGLLDTPLCDGGPTPNELLAAQSKIICVDPVAYFSLDLQRAVVVITFGSGFEPDLATYAREHGIQPDLLAATSPWGFRKLAGCLPP